MKTTDLMSTAQIISSADRIAMTLADLAAQLDANIFRVDSAGERGALTRLQHIFAATACVMRRPR
jgi:demethoxyubiquinone hydroxylase (CLK1/Coq7/Cat5 family)